MENKKASKPSLRSKIAKIIVIIQSNTTPKNKEESSKERERKFKFDLVALILKIIATIIAIFKLFK